MGAGYVENYAIFSSRVYNSALILPQKVIETNFLKKIKKKFFDGLLLEFDCVSVSNKLCIVSGKNIT